MESELDALPAISSAKRLGRNSDMDPTIAEAYRSYQPAAGAQVASILGAAGADALLGLRAALGLAGAEPARELRFSAVQNLVRAAAAPSYTFYNDCGPYDYDASCTEPCFGFAP